MTSHDRLVTAWTVMVALAAWTGAVHAHSGVGPWAVVGAGMVVIFVVIRQPPSRDRRRAIGRWVAVGMAIAISVGAVAGLLAARSIDGLDGVAAGPVAGVVTFVTDPEPRPDGSLRAEVRHDGRRHLATARSQRAIAALTSALAGESARITGTVEVFTSQSDWIRSRHLAGLLRIESVLDRRGAGPHAALANVFRRLLDGGAVSLPADRAALLAGLTLGDDRAQPPAITADFRAAGLTHLLAVSGSNLVVLLAVAAPLLRRLRLWPRFLGSVLLIAGFAVATRLEPSVVRAAAVGTVALWAATIGRSSGGGRHLAIAVTGLIVIDPMLVHAIGFRLSVAACVGILVLAGPLTELVRGPRWLRTTVSVTVSAQVAVAPVLVPVFGPMPLAAIPANVLAAPLAGALMVWGMIGGTIAGVVVGPAPGLAAALHVPTSIGLAMLTTVAERSARLPLGLVDLRHAVVFCSAGVCWALSRPRRGDDADGPDGASASLRPGDVDSGHGGPAHRGRCDQALRPRRPRPGMARRRIRAVGGALFVAALLAPALVRPPDGHAAAGWSADVWTDGPVAVVRLGAGASAVDILDVLHARQVRRVSLVVVETGRSGPSEVLDELASRVPVAAVLVASGASTPGSVPPVGSRWRVGGIEVVVESVDPTLRVRIGWARRGSAARGPPVGCSRCPEPMTTLASGWRCEPVSRCPAP